MKFFNIQITKIIIFIIFFLFFNKLICGQGFWTQKTSFPGAPQYHCVSFVIGQFAYVGLGGQSNNFWKYDPINDNWVQISSFPTGFRDNAIAFSIEGKGYVGTGYTNYQTIFNDLWEYDPTNDSWTQKTSMPIFGRISAIGFSNGRYGYAGAGDGGIPNPGSLNDLWEYNSLTDTWSQKANFPCAGGTDFCGFSLNAYCYFGPLNNGLLYIYDRVANTWTQKATFPIGTIINASTFQINGLEYIVTGWNGSTSYNQMWLYNSQTNSWIQKESIPSLPRRGCSGFSINGKGYVVNGLLSNGSLTNELWEYTPDTTTNIISENINKSFLDFYYKNSKLFVNSSQKVFLVIFDLLGNEVVTYNNVELLSKEINITKKGIYIYKATSINGVNKNGKFLIL